MIKDKIAKKLNSFDVESSMFLLSFIYLFVAIYFWNKLNENSFFLFFVCCYGILALFFMIPIFKKIILTTPLANKKTIEADSFNNFKLIFKEDMFDEFFEKAIKNKIIDEEMNWIYKEDKTSVRSILFNHLKNQNYLIHNLEKSHLTKCINQIFKKNDDKSMYSKSQYNYSNLKQLENQYPEFMIFNNDSCKD